VAGGDQEVLITRVLDAPRELVFKAWTDPDEVAACYGPEHMDTPRERISIDLRVGGRYELTMVRRGGAGEFTIGYEIVELVEPELIVLRSDPMPQAPSRCAFTRDGRRLGKRRRYCPRPTREPRASHRGWCRRYSPRG
jgi:uncharacterized protein YndB with AHSA1/START domain